VNPHSRLSAAFLRDHSAAAARVLEDFPAGSVAEFLATASPVTAGQVVEHFTPGFAASCLISIEQPVVGQIFTQLLPDLQITLLRLLDRDKRELLLSVLQPELAASIRHLLPYPEGTAGALMEAPLASVPEELSVREALKRIKRIRRGMKFYIYATNEQGQLTGVLTLHELINARPSTNISQVMHRHVLNLSPAQSIRSVIASPYWKEYHALPVTDENNVLLGTIRQKGLRRFQEQSVHVGAISGGLGAFIAVGELFSIAAGELLAALISTGTSLTQRVPRD
jgi:magnesium transporter